MRFKQCGCPTKDREVWLVMAQLEMDVQAGAQKVVEETPWCLNLIKKAGDSRSFRPRVRAQAEVDIWDLREDFEVAILVHDTRVQHA